MILGLDKLEMLLILEKENNGEKKMERGLSPTNTLQLLYPPIFHPIFPIKYLKSYCYYYYCYLIVFTPALIFLYPTQNPTQNPIANPPPII